MWENPGRTWSKADFSDKCKSRFLAQESSDYWKYFWFWGLPGWSVQTANSRPFTGNTPACSVLTLALISAIGHKYSNRHASKLSNSPFCFSPKLRVDVVVITNDDLDICVLKAVGYMFLLKLPFAFIYAALSKKP